MTIRFESVAAKDGVVLLRGRPALVPSEAPRQLRYRTRTGALLRIDGIVCGAFDGEHKEITLPGGRAGEVTLAVEQRSLPTRGMPSGDGLRWRLMLARAEQAPALEARESRSLGDAHAHAHAHGDAQRHETRSTGARAANGTATAAEPLALVGHSHLDIAWLWTYEEAARKALRTFATALRQIELDPHFIFTQSQPQLYEFVREREPELFARIAACARTGRLDASGTALWVEADCNLPSGESLLRQLAAGCDYAERVLGTRATVAWLPDSFGFPNTLPTLLRHAGVFAFGTTKLAWNDTTTFPFAQFVWEGPDGGRVFAAQIDSIAGGITAARTKAARARNELLLVGEGDGGGGTSDASLRIRRTGATLTTGATWTTLGAWFASLAAREAALPVLRDELYLQEHRGTATTHHDVKARNAALERNLRDTEEALAWAHALHATPFFLDEARRQLARAWEIVLRAQFHDVLPGTATAAVYADVFAQYDEADALVAHVNASAQSVLPVAATRPQARLAGPRAAGESYVFENDALFARVRRDGTLVELRAPGGPNLVRRANRLALYVDRPKRWDAWNLDRSYRSAPRKIRATACELADDALEVRYAFGSSLAVARISLAQYEPFVRVELAVAWHERHALLRCENALRFRAERARFGSPHGSVERTAEPRTREERAKYEAPGQRFARVDGAAGRGLAVLALDTYGWSARAGWGGTQLGHSLLRAPTWPDPAADRGEHAFSLAYAPLGARAAMGEIETLWDRFARAPSVAMFVSSDPRVIVVATKLATDGAGVIVRARECDGAALEVELACGARALDVISVDAREAPLAREALLREGAIVARFAPYEIRSFRVRLR